jgi:hypothetical protein
VTSVARTVKLNVPTTVGVPLLMNGRAERQTRWQRTAGDRPGDGAEPVRLCEVDGAVRDFAVPFASETGKIVIVGQTTVSVRARASR